MECIDTRGQWNHILRDNSRKITKEKLEKICLIHNGERTCRYIMMGEDGYVCVKNSKLQELLDGRFSENKMTSKGDNCEGMIMLGE